MDIISNKAYTIVFTASKYQKAKLVANKHKKEFLGHLKGTQDIGNCKGLQ